MGNRAMVVFHSGDVYSPQVYLHWGGSNVPKLLAALRERMRGRDGDPDYAAARFIGIAHEATPGNLSLGVSNLRPEVVTHFLERREQRPPNCPGDAGVFLVNVADWSVRRLSGSYSECAAPRTFTAGEVMEKGE